MPSQLGCEPPCVCPARVPLHLCPPQAHEVHLVGAVSDAERARGGPQARERQVRVDAGASVQLNGGIQHLLGGAGGSDLRAGTQMAEEAMRQVSWQANRRQAGERAARGAATYGQRSKS